jgi:eukaryotic-like serine/threonine-protein kinase
MKTEFQRLGPYVVLRASGAGGMARVDLALRGTREHAELFVLKRMHAEFRSAEQEARFRREAGIAARLRHDAIARSLGIEDIAHEPVLLNELVLGVDLRRLMDRAASAGESLPYPLSVYVVCEVARALDYAHGFGGLHIVHRDVTPDNIMLAFSGRVKLIDFGIARSDLDRTLTRAGTVVGRPVYTAPEVWEGARADRRADVYSLGVVLWQLATGKRLDARDSSPGLELCPTGAPDGLIAIAARALAPDPADRPQTAGQLRASLLAFLPPRGGGPALLARSLARHFDVERERKMLDDDIARARMLLAPVATPRPPLASPARPARTGARRALAILVAAAVVVAVLAAILVAPAATVGSAHATRRRRLGISPGIQNITGLER